MPARSRAGATHPLPCTGPLRRCNEPFIVHANPDDSFVEFVRPTAVLTCTCKRSRENGRISELTDFGLSYCVDRRFWFFFSSTWTVFVPDITCTARVNQYQIGDFHLVHRRAVTFTERRIPVLSQALYLDLDVALFALCLPERKAHCYRQRNHSQKSQQDHKRVRPHGNLRIGNC